MRLGLLVLVGATRIAAADPAALIATDSFTPTSTGDLAVDGGVVVGTPTALPTGLSRGVGVGVAQGARFAYGARVAWVTATESSMAWQVTHSDLRLRATGAVQQAIGRGTFGLRLALGGTLVHESRLRNQGERAGLMGDDLRTTAWSMVPAADVDVVVQLGIAGPWRLVMSGGPSMAIVDGGTHASWSAGLGVAWQP